MSSNKLFDFLRSVAAPKPVMTCGDGHVFRASLPSAIDGSSYDAQFAAYWIGDPQGPPADQEGLRQLVIHTSRSVTSRRSVHEIELTAVELNDHLARLRWPTLTNISQPRITVQLSASPEARRAAAEWEALRSQLAVEKMRNQLEIEQLRHLREDIFKKPDVARTYWLKHHPEATAEVLGDRFERIAEKLGATPETTTLAIAHLLHDFLNKLDADHQLYLIAQLCRVFGSYHRTDLADQLTAVSTGITAPHDGVTQ